MKIKHNKPIFFCGLGEKPKNYKFLSKYFEIINIDWNKIKLPKFKADVAIGFSMGAALACEYAEEHEINTIILCSLTPCIDTLEGLKAKEVIFILGEKEKWAYKNNIRLAKTLICKYRIILIPKAGHKIDANYRATLFNTLESLV